MKKLAGRAAIVTGASKGIGAAIAKALAAAGASVALNYSSDKDGAHRTAERSQTRAARQSLFKPMSASRTT